MIQSSLGFFASWLGAELPALTAAFNFGDRVGVPSTFVRSRLRCGLGPFWLAGFSLGRLSLLRLLCFSLAQLRFTFWFDSVRGLT